ncbi:dihydrofolate reductase [Microbacterium sp. cf046]|uniref:dihydrofolate reductase n=1 Tax=Microbacterium sp. cf046 TaxID=1761803 RepID=UPI0008DF3B1E|nr:dihydrofolate reductase [Microbacterium sp. cf046]SFS01601.1 dihydrofolate reductase [Microbacterium sp. cf046]
MTRAPRIGLIWAQAQDGVIGRDGGMPWYVPEDLAHFKAITVGSPVVMGRGTWDSLDPRYKPLPGRRNIVVTRQDDWEGEGAARAGSLDEGLQLAAADEPEWIWVIGGGAIFALAIPDADRLEVTELTDVAGFSPLPDDVRAPAIEKTRFRVIEFDPPDGAHTSRSGIRYRFLRYERAS